MFYGEFNGNGNLDLCLLHKSVCRKELIFRYVYVNTTISIFKIVQFMINAIKPKCLYLCS